MVEGAAVGCFAGQVELERLVLVGHSGEGQAEASGVADDLELFGDFGGHVVHLEVDGGGLDEPDATETPAGGGHFGDEFEFDGGLEFADEGSY